MRREQVGGAVCACGRGCTHLGGVRASSRRIGCSDGPGVPGPAVRPRTAPPRHRAGLRYRTQPEAAVVLSVDEKTQVRGHLDRTCPRSCRLSPNACQMRVHPRLQAQMHHQPVRRASTPPPAKSSSTMSARALELEESSRSALRTSRRQGSSPSGPTCMSCRRTTRPPTRREPGAPSTRRGMAAPPRGRSQVPLSPPSATAHG